VRKNEPSRPHTHTHTHRHTHAEAHRHAGVRKNEPSRPHTHTLTHGHTRAGVPRHAGARKHKLPRPCTHQKLSTEVFRALLGSAVAPGAPVADTAPPPLLLPPVGWSTWLPCLLPPKVCVSPALAASPVLHVLGVDGATKHAEGEWVGWTGPEARGRWMGGVDGAKSTWRVNGWDGRGHKAHVG